MARKIAITVTLDASSAITNAKRVEDRLNKLERSTTKLDNSTKGAETRIAGLTRSFILANIASRAISLGISSVTRSISSGTRAFIEYDFQLKKIQGITGTTGKDLAVLDEEIRRIGSTTIRTAGEVGATALAMSKLGLSSREVGDVLESVTQLSIAFDEAAEDTGKAVVAVLNAFQKEAKESKKVANTLANAFASSALDLEGFATAFAHVGAIAKSGNLSFEQLAASMGILRNAGIKASTVGTQLRQVIFRLADSSSLASKAIGGETIETIGFEESLRRLKPIVDDVATAKKLFGVRAAPIIQILANSADSVENLTKHLDENEGKIKDASDAIGTSLLASLKHVTSAWEDMFISIGKITSSPLVDFFNSVAGAINTVSEKISESAITEEALGRASGKFLSQKGRTPNVFDVLGNQFGVGDLSNLREQEEAAIVQEKVQQQILDSQKDNQAEKERLANEALKAEKEFEEERRALAAKELKRKKETLQADIAFTMKQIKLRELRDEGVGRADRIEIAQDLIKRAEELELIDEQIQLWGDVRDLQKKINDEEKKRKKNAEEVDAILNKGAKAYAEGSQKLQEMIQKTQELEFQSGFAFGSMQIGIEGVGTAVSGLSQRISGDLVDAIFGLKRETVNFGDIFEQTAKQMLSSMVNLLIRALLLRAVLSAFGGPLGLSAGKGLLGFKSSGEGLAGFLGQTLASGVGGVQQNAIGRDEVIRKPTLMLAGESGPERIRIDPPTRTGRSGGAQSGPGLQVIIQGDVFGAEKFNEAVNRAEERLAGRSYV